MLALFTTRTIVVSTTGSTNFNLRAAAGNPVEQVMVFCSTSGQVNSFVVNTPAFTTGTGWAPGSLLFLTNNGTIQGAVGTSGAAGIGFDGAPGTGGSFGYGGNGYADSAYAGSAGGNGTGGSATAGGPGSMGGIAFEALYPVVVTNKGAINGGVGGPGGRGGIGIGGPGGGGGGGGGGGMKATLADGSNPQYYNGGNGGKGEGGDGPATAPTVGDAQTYGGNGGLIGRAGYAGGTFSGYSPGITFTPWPGAPGGPSGKVGSSTAAADGSPGATGFAVSGYSNIKFLSTGTLTGPTK